MADSTARSVPKHPNNKQNGLGTSSDSYMDSQSCASAVICFAASGQLAKVSELLRVEPQATRSKDRHGATALMKAAGIGHHEIVKLLLTGPKPARPQVADMNGRTALHYAALGGSAHCARLLVTYGADCRVRCKAGRTALDDCIEHGASEVLRDLQSRSAGGVGVTLPPPPLLPLRVETLPGWIRVSWNADPATEKNLWRVQLALVRRRGSALAEGEPLRWITVALWTATAESWVPLGYLQSATYAAHDGADSAVSGLFPSHIVARLARANAFGWSDWSAASSPVPVQRECFAG